MTSKNVSVLIIGLSFLLLSSCRKDQTDVNINILGKINQVELRKSVLQENFSGIIVLAVNSNSDIYSGETDEGGDFTLIVPGGQKYVLFFYSSASQLLGVLQSNGEVKALDTGAASIDLGIISISGGVAVSGNEAELATVFTTTMIQKPDDVIFDSNTERVCSFFYNPMNDGDITIYKGCGDCLPEEINNRLRISVCVHEYDEDLNRTVCAIRNYYIVPGITDDLVTAFPGDVLYWYFTAEGMVQYKIVRGPGEEEPGAGEIPDFFEVGKTYQMGDITIKVLSPFNQTEFPALGEGYFDGFVFEFHENEDTRYTWIIKDIGEALYTNNNSLADDGTNIRMKVLYKKTGVKTYGTRPIWLTDQFVENLPDPVTWTSEKKNILSSFGIDSYFPVAEGLIWNYSDGTSVMMSNVDTVHNTFRINNLVDNGYMNGVAGNSELGSYIATDVYQNPDFLPVSDGTGYNPLVFEDSRVFEGLTFHKTGISNGYRLITSVTYTSLDYDLITPGLTGFDDCLVIKCSFSYPDGYNINPRISEVTHFIKKGIGFVQKNTKLSNNTETRTYLVSWH